MKPGDKIYIAGHRGLVGSALIRRFTLPSPLRGEGPGERVNGGEGNPPAPSPSTGEHPGGHKGWGEGGAVVHKAPYPQLLTRAHAELDLTDQATVEAFFAAEKPVYVFLAAAKVGGIHANNEYLKLGNFSKNPNKGKYAYILTPVNVKQRVALPRPPLPQAGEGRGGGNGHDVVSFHIPGRQDAMTVRLEEKTRITLAFLKRKEAEFKAIQLEIDALKDELKSSRPKKLT